MKRTLEPVDLMVGVGIGLCATLLGAALFFDSISMVPEPVVAEPVVMNEPTGIMTGMHWLQPVLGQAIVERYVLEREGAAAIAAAATELNRATLTQYSLQRSPFGHFDAIKAWAELAPAEHAGRIQEVMGRTVVNFTQRGVRTGILSPPQSTGEYNNRMIRLAEALGERMDEDFLAHWQVNLGRAILTASQDRATLSAQIQERVGAAIMQVAKVQAGYQRATEAVRRQLTAATNAAIRTELRADLFDHLAMAEPFAQLANAEPMAAPQATPVVEPKSSPDIPIGYLMAAFVGLIALFLGGLWLPSTKREEELAEQIRPEAVQRVYRKTA
jgi:hypothetical protein